MNIESKRPQRDWERRLQEVAGSFQYPTTPDISAAVHKQLVSRTTANAPRWTPERRRLAMAVLLALFMLATLLAVPTVRAAIARFLQVGAITIFVGETEAETMPSAVPAVLPTKQSTPTTTSALSLPTPAAVPDIMLVTPQTATPIVTRGPELEGPLTLKEAAEAVDFEIRLPDASTALGSPDEVYLEHPAGQESLAAVILVWSNPRRLETTRLTLYQIGVPQYAMKVVSRESLIESKVNGQPAYWIEGEHLLQLPDANGHAQTRLGGSVLLWTEGNMTYRLEGAPSVGHAVAIAQSLQPGLSR